jgi:hypothetical protein
MKNLLARNPILFAAAITLPAATAAFAQTPNASADQGMTMQGQTPRSTGGDTRNGKGAMAAPAARSHRRMARNEAAENAREAEITRQLNQEQAGMAKNGAGTP